VPAWRAKPSTVNGQRHVAQPRARAGDVSTVSGDIELHGGEVGGRLGRAMATSISPMART